MMILGRVGAGLGVGIMSMVVPLFNAEISPKQLRGRLVSLQQLSITFGIMVVNSNINCDLLCDFFTCFLLYT